MRVPWIPMEPDGDITIFESVNGKREQAIRAGMFFRFNHFNLTADPIERQNDSDHRAGTIIMQAEKFARKSGFACITLLCGVWSGFNLRSSFRVQEIVPIAGPVRQQHFED